MYPENPEGTQVIVGSINFSSAMKVIISSGLVAQLVERPPRAASFVNKTKTPGPGSSRAESKLCRLKIHLQLK